jgi:type III pantothenate kinase
VRDVLLAVDVGNSEISVGAFHGRELGGQWRIKTDPDRSGDEYGALVWGMMARAGIAPESVSASMAATVVPGLTRPLREMCPRYFGCEMEFLTAETPSGIVLDVEDPAEVGADRIANAVAAHTLYGSPAIVVDFGTATTFDVVRRGGRYVGGAILPGLGIAMDALFARAAQLARIHLTKPPSAIGRNTTTCIQSGFYYGGLGQIERILRETIQELGEKPVVIATGGLAGLLADQSNMVDVVDLALTLKGLQQVHEQRTSPPTG